MQIRNMQVALGASLVAAVAAFAPAAQAGGVGFSLSIGGPGYAVSVGAPLPYYRPYYAPYWRPVYVAPPVVYAPPRVVYVAPPARIVYRAPYVRHPVPVYYRY